MERTWALESDRGGFTQQGLRGILPSGSCVTLASSLTSLSLAFIPSSQRRCYHPTHGVVVRTISNTLALRCRPLLRSLMSCLAGLLCRMGSGGKCSALQSWGPSEAQRVGLEPQEIAPPKELACLPPQGGLGALISNGSPQLPKQKQKSYSLKWTIDITSVLCKIEEIVLIIQFL